MVLGLLLAVTIAAPARASDFGLNIQSLVNWDTLWGQPSASLRWEPYLDAMRRDGMTVARTDAAWSAAQPGGAGTPYDWSLHDRIAGNLARAGLRWLPVVDLTPAWAAAPVNQPPGCEGVIARYLPPAPGRFDDFAAYAAALAARYGANGTFWSAHPELPKLPITQYEVWNEPNVDAYWNNDPNPASYRALYDKTRAAIRAQDPAARVLVGGVVWGGTVHCAPNTPNAASWLQRLASQPGWETDGVAMHPYGASAAGVVANVRELRRGLAAAGRPDVPLEQTEIGWALQPADAPPTSQAVVSGRWFTPSQRAGAYALVTDVLRAADCPGTDFIGYAAVERERNGVGENPLGLPVFDFIEHWMGVYGFGAGAGTTAAPTDTSRAFAAAIARDAAGRNAPRDLRVCGAPEGGRVLALDLTVAPAAQTGCWDATVGYLGYPVADAELRGTSAIGTLTGTPGLDPVFTTRDGTATFCATQLGDLAVRAQLGGWSFNPDLVPPVARSPEVGVQVASLPVPRAGGDPGPPPPPTPACVLNRLDLPRQKLSTVVKRRRVATVVRLANLAPTGPCQTTLTVSIPVKTKKKGKKTKISEALLGTATATIGATTPQQVAIRLTSAGRKRLKRERAVTATVRIGLPQALPGAQAYARQLRLRR